VNDEMIQIFTSDEAKTTILRRDLAFNPPVPPAVQASLHRIFGQDLTPEEAVGRVLKDVQQRGTKPSLSGQNALMV
jgi:hypothetical protein